MFLRGYGAPYLAPPASARGGRRDQAGQVRKRIADVADQVAGKAGTARKELSSKAGTARKELSSKTAQAARMARERPVPYAVAAGVVVLLAGAWLTRVIRRR
jgi:hypothetical protein